MTTQLVLTVIADDKPGIVEQLSATVTRHAGNWLDSRMAQMAGKFAGILRVEIEPSASDGLITALTKLAADGIMVTVETTSIDNDAKSITAAVTSEVIHVIANDRPGIVTEVSATLSQLNVNVLELTSYCESAEMSALSMFKAQAIVEIPITLERDILIDKLQALSDDLIVELGER